MRLRQFDLTIDPISPIHVGSGEVLHEGLDFWTEGSPPQRAMRVLNVDRALLSLTEAEIATMLDGRVAARMDTRRRGQFVRYTLPVDSPGNPGQVRAFQRDSAGKPYLPGSTVKGAIRTALLISLLEASDLGTNARAMEERAFAFDLGGERSAQFANRDLNRALRVSDLTVGNGNAFAVLNTSAHRTEPETRRGRSTPIPIWCEVALPGAQFRGTLTIEEGSPWWEWLTERQRRAVSDPRAALRAWAESLRQFELRAWGAAIPRSLDSFYTGVQRFLQQGTALAVLGWGTGWQGKTVGPRLSARQVEAIADAHKSDTARWRGAAFPDRFPVTRKLASTPNGLVPLGWVRLTLAERRG